jgi:hypothetical protein
MTFSISEVSWIVFEPSTEKIHTSVCHHSVREAAGNISHTMMLCHRTMPDGLQQPTALLGIHGTEF